MRSFREFVEILDEKKGWHSATKGEWKTLPVSHIKDALNHNKSNKDRFFWFVYPPKYGNDFELVMNGSSLSNLGKGDKVKIGGKAWDFDYNSNDASYYFRKGDEIIRMSDHWSNGPLNVGRIDLSIWTLSDTSRKTIFEVRQKTRDYQKRLLKGKDRSDVGWENIPRKPAWPIVKLPLTNEMRKKYARIGVGAFQMGKININDLKKVWED